MTSSLFPRLPTRVRALLPATLVTTALVLLFLSIETRASSVACPMTSLGETAQDCPWAGVARALQGASSAGQALIPVLKQRVPALAAQVEREASNRVYQSLWGESINFDENAKDIIVAQPILGAFYSMMKLQRPKSPNDSPHFSIEHAGLEHTFGYLFSTLKTPYGYKRARWVQGESENGFGLTGGLLSPNTKEGTLFSNATYFAGRIAFRASKVRLHELAQGAKNVAAEIKRYDFSKLAIDRIEESAEVEPGKKVTLRTDLAHYLKPSGGSDAILLVYSIIDERVSPEPRIISAFPVAADYATGLVKPETLGPNQPVTTHNNAYVAGLSGQMLQGARTYTPAVSAN